MKNKYDRNEIICFDNDDFWKIVAGSAICRTIDDEILSFWGAEDHLFDALFTPNAYCQCLQPVTITRVPLSTDALINQIKLSIHYLQISHVKSHHEKMKVLLSFLANKFGKKKEDGIYIDLPLSHEIIAGAIASTRVTVTREIQKLEKEGFLIKDGRKLIVKEKENLSP